MNLKEKFENYTQPVDESSWESISRNPALVKYNRGRLIRRICGYGIPALVVIAALTKVLLFGVHQEAIKEAPATPQVTVPAAEAISPSEVQSTPSVAAPAPTPVPTPAAAAPVTDNAPAKATGVADEHIPTAPRAASPSTMASQPAAVTPATPTAVAPPATATPKAASPAITQPTAPVTVTIPDEAKSNSSDEPEEPVSEYDFFIPNAFTPNGDGINDLLFFKANFQPRTFEVNIYNRRGEQVYHSRNMENGWDGTYQGRELPGEVYSYVIKYTAPDNKALIRRGQVIIIR